MIRLRTLYPDACHKLHDADASLTALSLFQLGSRHLQNVFDAFVRILGRF